MESVVFMRKVHVILDHPSYLLYTVETRNLEVPGTCKNNSRHPEIDSSESGFLHVIEIYAVRNADRLCGHITIY